MHAYDAPRPTRPGCTPAESTICPHTNVGRNGGLTAAVILLGLVALFGPWPGRAPSSAGGGGCVLLAWLAVLFAMWPQSAGALSGRGGCGDRHQRGDLALHHQRDRTVVPLCCLKFVARPGRTPDISVKSEHGWLSSGRSGGRMGHSRTVVADCRGDQLPDPLSRESHRTPKPPPATRHRLGSSDIGPERAGNARGPCHAANGTRCQLSTCRLLGLIVTRR